MNTGGETAGILMAFSAEMGKEALKNSVELLKFLVMGYLKSKGDLNAGEVNMKRMLESGEEIKTIDINTKDTEKFASMAKEAGITFAFFQKGEENHTIAYLASEAELVNKLLDILKHEKVKEINDVERLLNEYKIGADRTFIVDKDNPENYIQVDTKEIEKAFIVDKDNPNNYIKIKEDLSKGTIEAEIHINGETVNVNGKDGVKEEILKSAKHFKAPDLVENETEIEKLKEGHIKNDDKKTMSQIDTKVKEVREELKNQQKEQKKQKEKNRERGDR